MDLFDIIGPVMIGPSSSHTAGAARIGLITRMLLGEAPVSAVIALWGSFLKTGKGHGTHKAIVGGLMGMKCDDIRLRHALRYAEEQGLEYRFTEARLRHAHPNTVVITAIGASGRTLRVQAASVGGGEIVVEQIDGLDAGFTGHENTLVITHLDEQGMIARISAHIAKENLNIATMRAFRREPGGEAVMVLELDGQASDALIEALNSVKGVFFVAYLTAL